MKWIFFIFLTFFIFKSVSAQESTIKFYGKIVNGTSPIINVTVMNKLTSQGTISDAYGEFALNVKAGDVINFSCIGYKGISYKIEDSLAQTSLRVLVSLIPDTILLKEAIVVPWPINTTMLRQAMLDQKAEDEKISPYAGFREVEGDPVAPEPKLFSNPLSFLYSKFNKKARQEKKMEKYREILQEDEMYVPEPIY